MYLNVLQRGLIAAKVTPSRPGTNVFHSIPVLPDVLKLF